ncbi:MAG: hypothetical protein JSR33_03170 [Proteobacteria bacterium]|nr:hypothetical protein [Pseudomonadota bacterium]
MDKFLSLDQLDSAFKKKLITEFLAYGRITTTGGLLTIKQIASRKRYSFVPSVLSGLLELSNYLAIIKAAKIQPIREFFVKTGSHWMSGVVEIDKAGQAKLLLLDSLSKIEIIKFYSKVFKDIFPEGKIYYTDETRQYDSSSCAVFALSDVRYLHVVNRYIGDQDLFSYLEAHKIVVPSKEIKDPSQQSETTFYRLPLGFNRIMQSISLTDKVLLQRDPKELALPINQKLQTAPYCARQDFKMINGKLQNKRAHYLLKKFFLRNFNYLNTHTDTEIQKDLQSFTLEAFKTRIQQVSFSKNIHILINSTSSTLSSNLSNSSSSTQKFYSSC